MNDKRVAKGEKPDRPKSGASQPGQSRPGYGKPGQSKTGYKKAGYNKPGADKGSDGKPAFGKADRSKAVFKKTSGEKPAHRKPDIVLPPVAKPVSKTADAEPETGERIAKALARAGVASRREVERYIEDRRVAVNGEVLTTPAVKVMPGDVLTVDGKVIGAAEPARVWRYNKPNGLVTTHKDPKDRATVFDSLPKYLPRVISVGRLDLNTEGLLLLTNDGELARALELPETGLKRRYRARARGRITQEKLDTLKDRITVDGVNYGSIEARIDKAKDTAPNTPQGANLWISLSLTEGKNREVRKVLEALGLTVNRLIRLSYGPFSLGDLPVGEVEEVGPRVIREQLGVHLTEDRTPQGSSIAAIPKSALKSRRSPTGKGEEPKVKPVYQAGWARPKPKPSFEPNKNKPRRGAPKPPGEKPG